jgi:hypothetical protein
VKRTKQLSEEKNKQHKKIKKPRSKRKQPSPLPQFQHDKQMATPRTCEKRQKQAYSVFSGFSVSYAFQVWWIWFFVVIHRCSA